MIRELDVAATINQRYQRGGKWPVVGHITEGILRDVVFDVKESRRQEVIRAQCKNVHAWGEGIFVAETDETIVAPIELAYDPYRYSYFFDAEGERPIEACSYLVIRQNQVFVSRDALPMGEPERIRPARNRQLFLFQSELRAA